MKGTFQISDQALRKLFLVFQFMSIGICARLLPPKPEPRSFARLR